MRVFNALLQLVETHLPTEKSAEQLFLKFRGRSCYHVDISVFTRAVIIQAFRSCKARFVFALRPAQTGNIFKAKGGFGAD